MCERIENLISVEHRFAKRKNVEYNVFSTETNDPSTVTKWVGLHRPFRVLMDPATYEKLRNHRIKWIFDDDNAIVACDVSE